ncbi:MAG: rhomboid family intramembrane serine protease, partial [Saprospiraceae bacterium]
LIGLISYQALNDRSKMYKLLHSPYQEARNKEYYRWITSMFVHANLTHLLINLFVFYSFGQAVEYYFVQIFGEVVGRVNFLLLFLFSGICADIPTFFKHKDNHAFSSVGASGAVSGVMMASVLFSPWAEWRLFFIIPVWAIVAAVLYLIYSSYASKKEGGIIDHDAHFYGAVFGVLFTILLKPEIFTYFLAQLQDLPF